MTRELTPQQKEERAADARALLHSEAFIRTCNELREECMDMLIQADVGDLTAARAHGIMKGLEAIKQRLQSHVNDELMATKRGRR